MKDCILRATGKVAEVRYVLADLTRSVQAIGSKHGLQGPALELLGDACVASTFLSACLKSAGLVSFEARFKGEITSVVAESTPLGLLRAKIRHEEALAVGAGELHLEADLIRVRKLNEHAKLLSEGIVEMADVKIGKALTAYMLQSEQSKTATGIFTKVDPQDPSKILYCAGYYVEALPKIDEKTTSIQEQVLIHLPSFDSMVKDGVFDIKELMEQVAGPFEYEIHREFEVQPFCPCSKERMVGSLAALPLHDLQDLAKDNESLEAHCDFCRTRYEITPTEVNELIEEKRNHK